MTKLEQMNLKRNAEWTKQALANKNWNGEVVETKEEQPLPNLPKDNNGQVIVPNNLDSTVTKAFVSKPVFKKSNPKSPFVNEPVVNAFSGF